MDTEHSCSCCWLRQPVMDMKIPYTRLGKTEIYADMLKECFEIQVKLSANDECGICKVCVGRLRDASDFKLQVLCTQAELQARLERPLCIKEEEALVKSEISDDPVPDEELILQEVKLEAPEDPLPADGSDDSMDFAMNFENHVSNVWQQQANVASNSEEVPKSHRVKELTGLQKAEKPGYTCATCGEHFVLKKMLNHHIQLHMKQRYKCNLCDKLFKFRNLLHLHNRRRHAGQKFYHCELCDKKYASKCAMNEHNKKTHVGKPYRCGECDKLFINKRSFRLHTHSRKVPSKYKCDMCDVEFKTKQTLIAHIGRHTGTMHFSCNVCKIKFWDYPSMLAHKRFHTEGSHNYICDVCHKVFTIKNRLAIHLKSHLDRKYSCEFCKATSKTLRDLQLHKLIHTDERKYPCKYCNKRFRYKHHMLAHIRIHTGEKPHCCEICGKKFARKDNLKTHLATHVDGKRYHCELCTKSYPTKEGLRQHKRTHTRNKDDTSTTKPKERSRKKKPKVRNVK